MRVRLAARLFASYVLVVAVGALTAFLTVRLLLPPLFEHRMGAADSPGMGMHGASGAESPREALVPALDTALLVGVAATTVAAGLVAAFVTSRLLRPLEHVRAATRRIAAGDYRAAVPLPAEPELAALAADVNTLAGTLADTETRRTRLLGDVAHEMRTPVTALDGYVEGLVDGVFTADPQTLQAMSEELHRLHRLAEDLSSLSRTEERRVELRTVDADLAAIAQAAARRLRPQFDDAGVVLTVRAEQSVPVRADVDRVGQVLTNLLGNALRATPRGGTVVLEVSREHGSALARVRDTGVGLDPQDRERVFERFYRASDGLPRSGGSGVGLTIARGLARAHGGDLTAASPGRGHGATFTLTLPVAGSDGGPAAGRGKHPQRWS